MIGNDVVDLALARVESNWRRSGYLQKIFTSSEQQIITNAPDPDVAVWRLWSRKEAAYKIYNRQTGVRAFNPLRFECDAGYGNFGVVHFGKNVYHTLTDGTCERIQTVALPAGSDWGKVQLSEDRAEIEMRDGIPYHRHSGNAASVSHHGRFLFVAFVS